MQKLTGALAALVFTATLSSAAFAQPPATTEPIPGKQQQQPFQPKSCQLKEFIKDSLAKHKGDLNKVKLDVAQFMLPKQLRHEARLEQLAKANGMSAAELKAQIKQKREARLVQKAKELGLTPEELKKQMQLRHDQKLQHMAQELGLTLEQLKQILPARSGQIK